MRRVRPGTTVSHGGRGSRAAGEERALTSVAAGDRHRGGEARDLPRLWHVTLSVSGEPAPVAEVRRALEQLAHDHPFLLTSRYADDHAEIRYWEEARDLHDAAAVALRLWGEHRRSRDCRRGRSWAWRSSTAPPTAAASPPDTDRCRPRRSGCTRSRNPWSPVRHTRFDREYPCLGVWDERLRSAAGTLRFPP